MFSPSFFLRYLTAEARHNKARFGFVLLSYVLGIAILTSLLSFNESFKTSINAESKNLLGADIILTSSAPFSNKTRALLTDHELAEEISFSSLVNFPNSDLTRLVNIKAIKGNFPFYGQVILEKKQSSFKQLNKSDNLAVIDQGLSDQLNDFNLENALIGDASFKIIDAVQSFPGESYSRSLIIPKIYIPYESVNKTALLKKGSRISYKLSLKTQGEIANNKILLELRKIQIEEKFEIKTVEEAKESIDQIFDRVSKYILITSIVALLLGTLGVASSWYSYAIERKREAAMLLCLGATKTEIIRLFFAQSVIYSIIGGSLGIILGLLTQRIIPNIFHAFLPINVESHIHGKVILETFFVIVLTSLASTLLPLRPTLSVSPLNALKQIAIPKGASKPLSSSLIIIILTILYLGTATLILNDLILALTLGFLLLVLFTSVYLISLILEKILKSCSLSSLGFAYKYALTRLYRANQQTRVVITIVSLTTFILSTIYISKSTLLKQFEGDSENGRANMILFDVQQDQLEGTKNLLTELNLATLDVAPIVTMRLKSINGIDNLALRKDKEIPVWTLKREYRSTYREHLLDSEKMIKGDFFPRHEENSEPVPVTVEDGLAENLKLKIGDLVTFDVQGIDVQTVISGIRKVNWRRIQTNFFFLFPKGVLDDAPQFIALMTRINTADQRKNLHKRLATQFPNVSAIDIQQILETVDKVLDQALFAIQFLALFTLVSALLILTGALATNRIGQKKELKLLKTLGATDKQISKSSLLEFMVLGLSAIFIGNLLAILVGFILSKHFFNSPIEIEILPLTLLNLFILGLVILVGIFSSGLPKLTFPSQFLKSKG